MPKKQTKLVDKNKRGRTVVRVDERILPKKSELEGLPLKWQIFKIKTRAPIITNVQIAEILKCDEALVRRNLKGEMAEKLQVFFNQQYINHFFHLQPKAFKRLEQALDDPKTEIKDVISICKYILDKTSPISKDVEQKPNEIIWETSITESGTLKRIEKKVYGKKEEFENSQQWKTIDVDTEGDSCDQREGALDNYFFPE
jgi:hypothetical protein